MIDRSSGLLQLRAILQAALFALCLAASPPASAQDAPAPPTLDELIDRESEAPLRFRGDIPRTDILADWGAPPADESLASLPEAEILDRYRERLPGPPVDAEPVVSEEDAAAAEALFSEAAEHREQGRNDQALASLRQAAKLNPASPDIWREFGLALAHQSNAIAARTALSQAIARGDDSFEGLFAYGRLAAQFREDKPAAAALLAAAAHPDSGSDPASEYILAAELGSCLLRLGHLDAATRRLEAIAELPATFEAVTVYREELNDLYRARRRLLNEAAEASYSIGDLDRSLRFTQTAIALPGTVHPRELASLCYLLLRADRPASAAQHLLDRFVSATPDPQSIELLALISSQSDIAPAIARRLDEIASRLPAETAERSRQAFTIAAASIHRSEADQARVLHDHLREHPTDIAVLGRFVRTASIRRIEELLSQHPAVEPELSELTLSTRPDIEHNELSGALRLRSLCRQGEFDAAIDLASELASTERVRFDHLCIVAELIADAARGSEADALLDAAAAQAESPADTVAVSRALLERGRYRDAIRLVEPIIRENNPQHSAPRLLALQCDARARLKLGDTDASLESARLAIESDPYCLPAARFLATTIDAPSELKRLREIPGSEPDLLVMQARAALAREQFDLTERLLLEAWEHPLASDETAELLARLWILSDSIPRAERWLSERVAERPDRTALTVLLSRVRAEDRRPEDSLNTIADALVSRPGSEPISRELERILREDFASEERWLSQARSRLANAPKTFATFAEQAEVELLGGDLLQSITVAELATDLAPTLTPTESRLLSRYLEDIARDIANTPRVQAETVAIYERVFDRLDRPSRGAWLGRISIGSIRDVPSADELTALARRAGQMHPDILEEAYIYAAHAVMLAARTGQSTLSAEESGELAAEIYSSATDQVEPFPTAVLGEWIEFSQQTQSPFTLGQAIRSLGERRGPRDRRLRDALLYLLTRGSARQEHNSGPERIADAAYHLASQLSLSDQFDTASHLYEEALRSMPDHIEANNSYGYRLLERNEQVDRAIGMIEHAYALSPDSAHITDSLGWARYRQGRIEDEIDPVTQRVQPGAVSLLRRASALAQAQDTTGMNIAFTSDHLGDALWASGDRDRAVLAWTEAALRGERTMRGFSNSPLPIGLEVELQGLIEGASEKARAASEDRPPQIAPRLPSRSETPSPR